MFNTTKNFYEQLIFKAFYFFFLNANNKNIIKTKNIINNQYYLNKFSIEKDIKNKMQVEIKYNTKPKTKISINNIKQINR